VGDHAVRRGVHLGQVTGVQAGQRRAVGTGQVNHPAGRHVLLERPARLLLDVRPGGVRNRSELAMQVVHG